MKSSKGGNVIRTLTSSRCNKLFSSGHRLINAADEIFTRPRQQQFECHSKRPIPLLRAAYSLISHLCFICQDRKQVLPLIEKGHPITFLLIPLRIYIYF